MFEQLVLVDHPNIVKLHKYWLDVKDSKARVGRPRGDRVPGGPPGWGREPGDPSSAAQSLGLPFLPRTLLPAACPQPCLGPALAVSCWPCGEPGKLTPLFPPRSSSSQSTCRRGA